MLRTQVGNYGYKNAAVSHGCRVQVPTTNAHPTASSAVLSLCGSNHPLPQLQTQSHSASLKMLSSTVLTLLATSILSLVPVVSCQELFIEPGPGLPSLESLGITPAQLYNLSVEHGEQVRNSEPGGGPRLGRRDDCSNDGTPAGWNNANACAVYLNNLGTTNCGAPRDGVTMCIGSGAAGELAAHIIGYNVGPGNTASSWCRDVSTAVTWVLQHCNFCGNGYCGVEGEAKAYGNGNLEITVVH